MINDIEQVVCEDLDSAIERYRHDGYRLDMIFPADCPREALVSKNGSSLRLVTNNERQTSASVWRLGRAGMMYRDLLDRRNDNRAAISHIRLTEGGAVPDYVHYHKIEFQLICCIRGRIKVVYEDQGPPFWLEAGDRVLQPPEIRHRVLDCTTEAEVIEVSVPADHETWVDHDMELPTSEFRPDREFSGKRFFHYKAPN